MVLPAEAEALPPAGSGAAAGAEGEGGTAPASAEAVCRASAPAIDGGRSVPALATPSGTIAPPPDAPCAAAGADAAGAVVPSEGEPAPGSVFAGKDGTAPADASVGVRSCEEAEGAASEAGGCFTAEPPARGTGKPFFRGGADSWGR